MDKQQSGFIAQTQ